MTATNFWSEQKKWEIKKDLKWQFPPQEEFSKIKRAIQQGDEALNDLFYSSHGLQPHVQVNDLRFSIKLEYYDSNKNYEDPFVPVLELNGIAPERHLSKKDMENNPYPTFSLWQKEIEVPYLIIDEVKDMDYEEFCSTVKEQLSEQIERLQKLGVLDTEDIYTPATDFWEKRDHFEQEQNNEQPFYAEMIQTNDEADATSAEIQERMRRALFDIRDHYENRGTDPETVNKAFRGLKKEIQNYLKRESEIRR